LSAHRGDLDQLEGALTERFRGGRFSAAAEALLFTDRQLSKLRRVLDLLDARLDELDPTAPIEPELLSIDLREVHQELEEVTGAIATEDTLDKIFSRFCLGK
ncbi:MAG: hypothetical protein KDC38_18980, partial [Planctomycetes bacterium]|nr:hypothetical protein [Planctomycetota bacterium]